MILLAGAFIIAIAIAFAILLPLRQPSDRSIAAFAKTYGVPITTLNVADIGRYIWWARCWRTAGALVAVAVFNVIRVISGDAPGFDLSWIIVGYAFGAMIGECFRPTERSSSRVVATVERRRITDYVSPWMGRAAGVTLVSALGAATWLFLHPLPQGGWFVYAPNRDRPESYPFARFDGQLTSGYVAVLTALIVLVAVGATGGVRRMVQTAVPTTTPDRQAVHHAVRTAAILSVIGGATMAIGTIGARLATEAAMSDGGAAPVVQWGLNLSLLCCIVSALWGGLLTLNAIPRFAPFAGPLPALPDRS